MAEFPSLQSSRLRLREIVDADAGALLRIHGDAAHMRWFGSDPLADLEAARKLVAMFAGWQKEPVSGTRWALELRDRPGLIGTCGLFRWNRNWRSCVLGYEIAPAHQGQGYVKEALRTVIPWGFQAMGLHRVEAHVHPQNAASLALLKGLGFRQEGHLREAGYWCGRHHDLLQFALLQPDWLAPAAATTPSILFRSVEATQGEALAAWRVEAMRPSLERVGRFDPERARARFLSTFSASHTREIVADGVPVGFFVVKPAQDGLALEHLYVRPAHQGQGIGAAVLRSVFAQADALGCDLRVGALKESDSNRFYLRHGFLLEREAEFDNYYVRRPAPAQDVHVRGREAQPG